MNEVGVSEVLNNLDRYVPKADGGDTTVPQQGTTGDNPTSTDSVAEVTRGTQNLTKILESNKSQQIESSCGKPRTCKTKPPVIPSLEVVIDGVNYLIAK
jgi:hypothetical protein